MKTGLFAVAALLMFGAQGAFASQDVVSLAQGLHRHHSAPSCTPDPGNNKYSLCNAECRVDVGDHSPGEQEQCIRDCVSRYCEM